MHILGTCSPHFSQRQLCQSVRKWGAVCVVVIARWLLVVVFPDVIALHLGLVFTSPMTTEKPALQYNHIHILRLDSGTSSACE